MGKIIKTNFYADGKLVWHREWYKQLSTEEIEQECKYIENRGLGKVDAVTDTEGRMVKV